jgi:hypothetical protein
MVMGIKHFSKWIEMIALSKKFAMGYQFKQTSLTSFSPLFVLPQGGFTYKNSTRHQYNIQP